MTEYLCDAALWVVVLALSGQVLGLAGHILMRALKGRS
jgi:hypothetical protein